VQAGPVACWAASEVVAAHARSRIDTARALVVLLGEAGGGNMGDEMGTFRVTVEIEHPARPGERRTLEAVLVGTGAELSWVAAPVLESLGIERIKVWHFRQANGTVLARWTGGVRVRVG